MQLARLLQHRERVLGILSMRMQQGEEVLHPKEVGFFLNLYTSIYPERSEVKRYLEEMGMAHLKQKMWKK